MLISDLLNAGAEDARTAAVVSRALDPPIDGVVALVEDGVRTEHPFAFAKLPERNRRVGFTENHLDVATELCDAITRERDAASRRDGADPFAGARAFLPGWAEEIRARIQRELIGQGRLAARIERPDDLIAIWRYRAEVWPWPDVAHEFERYFDDLAGGKVEHPASAEIARLDAKAESEPLTPEEEARRAELDRQRQNDTYRAVSQITLDVQRRMPSDEALRFLDKIATRIDQAQKDRTNRQLLATELSAAWNSAFSRAPDLACDRLRHAKDIESPWSAAAVAANCACEALCIAAPKSPQAAAALADFAVNAPNAALRWRGLVSARNLTPQQAEDVFSRALTDASSADPRWSAEDRRQLADGAVALADYNAASGSVSPEWLGESIVRVLEAGLWPEPAALGGDRDGRATRLANVLTDAQVAALEASGKLPAWVKAARAKPSGAK